MVMRSPTALSPITSSAAIVWKARTFWFEKEARFDLKSEKTLFRAMCAVVRARQKGEFESWKDSF